MTARYKSECQYPAGTACEALTIGYGSHFLISIKAIRELRAQKMVIKLGRRWHPSRNVSIDRIYNTVALVDPIGYRRMMETDEIRPPSTVVAQGAYA